MAKTKLHETIDSALDAMSDILNGAAHKAGLAATLAANEANTNGAIGAIVDLEDDLETALALYRTALALHRRNRE